MCMISLQSLHAHYISSNFQYVFFITNTASVFNKIYCYKYIKFSGGGGVKKNGILINHLQNCIKNYRFRLKTLHLRLN